MATVNIHEAKTHLSRLLERIANGEEIVIAKAGKPVALLIPYCDRRAPRVGCQWKGLVRMRENFDEPLPPAMNGAFLGERS